MCWLPEISARMRLQLTAAHDTVNRVWKVSGNHTMMLPSALTAAKFLPFQEPRTVDDDTYEVFKKGADNTTVSVEAVKGLAVAKSVLAPLRAAAHDEYYLV
jgi:hypothetical protein